MDRPNGGFSRGYGQSNNVRAQPQAPADKPQPARQEEEWSSPTNVERRDNTERCQTTQASPPVPLLPWKKDYLPTGVVKALQEKE